MKLLIDADGCPVVDNAVRLAKRYGVEVLILCDTAHVFEKDGAQTITVSKGADSVDYALVNRVSPGDLVVTQDYGLAAMCLAKRAIPLNQKRPCLHQRQHRRTAVVPPRGTRNLQCWRPSQGQCQTQPKRTGCRL